jgi:hypothetical protein
MIGRKPTSVCIADEKQMAFLMASKDGSLERHASLSVDEAGEWGGVADALAKEIRQAVNQLLVVPDYWIGNDFHEFRARKKTIIAAFIERKLRLDQPSLTEAVNFYDYAMVQDQDRRQLLYCTYLQEPLVYRLYRRLEALGISPRRIATPALIWQSKLSQHIDGFAQHGIGFVHLTDGNCFLYFFHLGQFLFSRHIQLPATDGDSTEICNLLNYEINQSFYLYSQKTKRSVDTLFMLAQDPAAIHQLSELLGRQVQEFPPLPCAPGLSDEDGEFASCCGFSVPDLKNHILPSISYKPLQKEMTWRPVQWAGMAIGIALVVLLAAEAGYLHLYKNNIQRQFRMVTTTSSQKPEQAIGELTQILEEITGELGRPSGSGVMMRTLLAMPRPMSLKKITLDTLDGPRVSIDALVNADQPDAFKAILDELLSRINQRFDLEHHPLTEKDIRIGLERMENNERQPLYQIQFSFELT